MTESASTPKGSAPRWKIVLTVIAGLLLVAAAGLKIHGMATRDSAPAAGRSAPPPGGSGLVASSPDKNSPPAEPQQGTGEKVSPFLAAGGFSFFAGLAVGTVLRMFYKIALVVVGVGVLGLAGLSYSGVIGPINWASISEKVDGAVVKVEEKTQGMGNQLLLGIPSAGMAGAGLMAGFKKR